MSDTAVVVCERLASSPRPSKKDKKIFVDCSVVPPNNAMPPNFTEKTFANSHKTSKYVKVFSLKSFTLYGTLPYWK